MKLVFSAQAREDLLEIEEYIGQANPRAAMNFLDKIMNRCEQIGQFPGIGRRRFELKTGYRSLVEGQYIILYRVSNHQVEVVRVLHGKRDFEQIMKERRD